jgi:chitodextrinase
MTILGLKSQCRGLGLSPRRRKVGGDGSGPPGDSQAPTVPQNLSATAISDQQIDLTWEASSDNVGVVGYRIYRDDALIDTSPTNAYSDSGLDHATEYEYEVSALDGAANESARNATQTETTSDATAP